MRFSVLPPNNVRLFGIGGMKAESKRLFGRVFQEKYVVIMLGGTEVSFRESKKLHPTCCLETELQLTELAMFFETNDFHGHAFEVIPRQVPPAPDVELNQHLEYKFAERFNDLGLY